jgi:hypothetical protein
MPFITNEDEALKTLLKGITVSDSGNPKRSVGVWFGQPDKEIRQQSYPYITIDLIGMSEAGERVQSGVVDLQYTPEGYDGTIDYQTYYPMPVNLDYQVATYSRQPNHDRQIMGALFQIGRLPVRFGSLYVPQDNTLRRLDVLGFSKRDTTEADKRLFVNIYTIRVSSEIFRTSLFEKDTAPVSGTSISVNNTNLNTSHN